MLIPISCFLVCMNFFFFFFYCDIWSGYHILHADNDSDKYLDNVVAG
jgi:hypothetical protein